MSNMVSWKEVDLRDLYKSISFKEKASYGILSCKNVYWIKLILSYFYFRV